MSNRIAIVPHLASVETSRFGGAAGGFSFADSSPFLSRSHTIGIWANHVSYSPTLVGGLSLAFGYGGFSEALIVNATVNKANQANFLYIAGGFQNQFFDNIAITVSAFEWAFYTLSILQTLGPNNVRTRFYRDGVLIGEYNVGAFRPAPTAPFVLGAGTLGTFHGKLAGAFFCTGELQPQEIQDIYLGRKRPQEATGIVSYWPMNEGLGGTITDVVGGNTGTLVGTSVWSTDVPQTARAIATGRQVATGRLVVPPGTRTVC